MLTSDFGLVTKVAVPVGGNGATEQVKMVTLK